MNIYEENGYVDRAESDELNRTCEYLEDVLDQRDFLVEEYERAVGSEPLGYFHAAAHLYNAISNARCDANTKYFIKLREERDALAAHVERLRSALNYSSEYLYDKHLNTIGHGSKAHMEMVSALEDTPTTSLTRRDLIKQAEALEEVALGFGKDSDARDVCLHHASDLRRQAEGVT